MRSLSALLPEVIITVTSHSALEVVDSTTRLSPVQRSSEPGLWLRTRRELREKKNQRRSH